MPEDVWLEAEVSVPWPDDRCILCLNGFTEDKRQCRTREHVIPVSLGGELLVDFLCKHCNNKFGTVVDSQLREETRLRFRLGVNPAQIPKVFESATNSLEFRGRAGGDWLDLKRRDCKDVPLTSQPDGSMIVRSDADSGFIQHLNRRLHPEALPQAPIVRVTPDNRALPLPPFSEVWPKPGRLATSWMDGVEHIEPGAGTALRKIAYEFLALHIGAQIYDPKLHAERQALLTNTPASCRARIVSGMPPRDRDYGAIHGLAVDLDGEDKVEVIVCLFGHCLWRITFPWLQADPSTFHRVAYELQLAVTPRLSRFVQFNGKAGPEGPAS